MEQQEIQNLCDRLNACLPCKSQRDVDELARLLDEEIRSVPGRMLYWSREIYIDAGFDDARCLAILIHSGRVRFVPSGDPEEHPGVTVRYEYETEIP